jgi:hypothetical protein
MKSSSGTALKPRFVLRSAVLSERFEHALTAEDFANLKKARSFLADYMQFEETVLQVIHASMQFESFLLETSLKHYFFPTGGHDAIQDTRLLANLPVLTFLNSVTSFRDQFPKFKQIDPKVAIHSLFKDLWDKQKADSVAFSFCERFRNYGQHQTKPVSGVTLGSSWDKGRNLLEANTSVFVEVMDVCKNHQIKSTEKAKYIDAFGKHCDISLIFRETTARIGSLVKTLRDALKAEFETSVDMYQKQLDTIRTYKRGLILARAASVTGSETLESFDVFSDFVERAKHLRQTYVMTNNSKHFVSNKARGHIK